MRGAGSEFAGRARTAVILGSGLSGGSPPGEVLVSASYDEIEGLRIPSVDGHPGTLSLVAARRRNLIVFSGRSHLYEGGSPGGGGSCVRAAARLGCSEVILAHAAGSLTRSIPPASWLIPGGIVCFPWRGSGGAEAVSGRPAARPCISVELRAEIERAAGEAGEPFAAGVLYWTAGPSYETPAEGRAAVAAGADAAAMSPLPELSEAAVLGLGAACLSRITNYTPNAGGGRTDHGEVLASGLGGTGTLSRILASL